MSHTEQMQGRVKQINLSDIRDLPVQVNNTSKKLIKIIQQTLQDGTDQRSPVLVGRVNSVYYAINDFETVLGFRKAGVERIDVVVTEYPSIDELLVVHVQKNFHPQAVDPLKIRQIVDYMAKNGMGIDEICKKLWLDKHPKLYATIRLQITDEARNTLLELVDEISTNVYSVVTPIYYVSLLAKIVKEQQNPAAKQMKALTLGRTINDEKFSWPSHDAILSMLREYSREKKKTPVEESISDEHGDMADLKKSAPDKSKKKIADDLKKKASKYISADPDLIYVPVKADHPDLLVNKKTGRIAVASEKDEVYAITDDLGKITYTLPDHVTEHLEVEAMDSVFIYKYPTFEKAEHAVARARKLKGKCAVLSTVKIPKR